MITRLGTAAALLALGLLVIIAILRSVMRGNPESVFRSKTLLVTSALMIVGVLGATIVATLFILDIMERQNRQRLAENLEATIVGRGAHIESWINAGLHRAVMLSETESIIREVADLAQGTNAAVDAITRDMSSAHVHHFAILDERGRNLVSTIQSPDGGVVSWSEVNPQALRRVLAGKPSFFAPTFVMTDDGTDVRAESYFAAPISLGPGQPNGVVIATFDLGESPSDVCWSAVSSRVRVTLSIATDT